MDLKKMQTFETLCEIKNFSKAAEVLYIAQSSLSAQIKSLEEELETSLILRSSKNFELTESGRIFLRFCQKTLLNYEDLLCDLGKASERRNYTIGLFYCTRLDAWCDRIAHENSRQGDVTYNIRLQYGTEKIESLLKREIPIGFCQRTPVLEQNGFQFRHVFYDRLYLYVPSSNPLSKWEELNYRDLVGQKIVVINTKRTKVGADSPSRLAQACGFAVKDFIYRHSLEDIYLAMKSEGCVALLPYELHPSGSKQVSLPESVSERLDYGWYYEKLTPEVQWVLDNLY